MDIKSEGEALLEIHKKLRKELIEIPKNREMTFVEEIKEGGKIGKPRFKNPKYQLPKDLMINLRDHLQNIWNFFNKYSYWFDDTLMPLLHSDERRVSKKSIIFLLEEDVWSTDEVYGDYLIEEIKDSISISYSRRDRKLQQVILESKEESEIKEWICRDAIGQIQNQFEFLWTKLETEIQALIDEIFHKPPKFTLEPDYLKEQLDKTIEISEQWAEAGLLNLGRILEHWLLNKLGMKRAPFYSDLIRDAEIARLIDKNEEKLLRNIRSNYNNLKHKTYYKIDIEDIKLMVKNFSKLFES
ncbi:MAG: hypothetical protein ACFFG0_10235 [Candidatus Thorarchaeota archaeon]